MLRRNILIFHQAALGDFLMTWPLAMALGRIFAQNRVLYVTHSQKGRLAERMISVESVDSEAGWHVLHEPSPSLPPAAARLLAGAQLVIVFAQGDEPVLASNLRLASGDATLLMIAPNPPQGVHVMDHQLSQLQHLPPLQDGVRQMQQLIRTQGLSVPTPPRARKLLIHPGSGSPRKNWPIESFLAAARQASGAGWQVEFVLGEAELERLSPADRQSLAQAAPVRDCLTLDALGDAITGAEAYLGNDSGPTHLAAILGRRVVAMYGPASDASAWAPVGPRVTVLPFETPVGDVVARLAGN